MKIGPFTIWERYLHNHPGRVLLSLHWKWSVTWRFLISWHPDNGMRGFKSSGGSYHYYDFGSCFGLLCFHTQPNMKRHVLPIQAMS